MKSCLYLLTAVCIMTASAYAQDIEAKLGGSTNAYGFTVKDNSGTGLFTVRGTGIVGIPTTFANARFYIANPAGSTNALRISTESPAGWSGIYLNQTGLGNAARFDINNASSTNNCLEATTNGTAAALWANSTHASGKIIELVNSSATRFSVASNGSTLIDYRLGIGTSPNFARLEIDNSAAGGPNAIRISTNSTTSGIYLTQTGTGNAARFDINNGTSSNNCLEATTNGTAAALWANSTNSGGKILELVNGSNTRFSLSSSGVAYVDYRLGIGTTTPSAQLHIDNSAGNGIRITGGTGSSAIWVTQTSTGNAARFDITNSTSTNNCLEASTSATAPALYASSSNTSGRIVQFNNGSTERFFVETTGNVGIGVDDATQDLDVLNNARIRGVTSLTSANELRLTSLGILTTHTSDARLKTNVRPLKNALDAVLQLNPVRFHWASDASQGENIGFIAQEMEKVFPEFVFTNSTDGYMGINYSELTAVLTEAVKEQQALIDELSRKTEQVTALQQRVQELETQSDRIREVEAQLASLKALLQERNATGDESHAALQSGK